MRNQVQDKALVASVSMARTSHFGSKGTRRGFISEEDVLKELAKKRLELKELQRLSKLQKKFEFSTPMRGTRASIKKRIQRSPNLTAEAKKKAKIFEFKGLPRRRGRGGILVPAVPKGVKIQKRKRKSIL